MKQKTDAKTNKLFQLVKLIGTLSALFIGLPFLILCCLYLYDINQDNFLINNDIRNSSELEGYFEANLPLETTTLADFMAFVDENQIECDLESINSSNQYSGSIFCNIIITDPRFLFGNSFFSNLQWGILNRLTAYPYARTTFTFRSGHLSSVELSFHVFYI